MIQLAGHLKGRALQESNLLHPDSCATFPQATGALHSRLNSASKMVAARDFRHTAQLEAGLVSDFMRRLECTFHAAYGRDVMSAETQDTSCMVSYRWVVLRLMQGPAVPGAAKKSPLQ